MNKVPRKVIERKPGTRFGSITLVEYIGKIPGDDPRYYYWKVRCDCGKVFVIRSASFSRKRYPQTSCGCLAERSYRKHGLASKLNPETLKTYNSWVGMMTRCYNPKSSNYEDYGGRGITVDERWHDAKMFFEDMGLADPGMTLERLDFNKGYSKDNCIWANRKTQCRNTRRNIFYEWKDERMTLSAIAEMEEVSYRPLHRRVRDRGQDVTYAVAAMKANAAKARSSSRQQQ